MHEFKSLVLMQLKDKVDFSFLKSKKQTIFKIVLSILKFAIITVIIYFGFFLLQALKLVSYLKGIPQNFITVVFTLVFLIATLVCIVRLVKILYFSKDNMILLTLPVGRTDIFTSKLVVYFIYEYIKNIYFMLPLFVAYGIINGAVWYFYLLLPIILIFVTMLEVVISALLSIPAMILSIFIGNRKWLEVILIAIGVFAVVFALYKLINAIPENFDLVGDWVTTYYAIQTFLNSFISIMLPFDYLTTAIIGNFYGSTITLFTTKQLLSLAGIIGTILVIFGLTYLIVRPLFFKMVSNPFEYKKSKVVKHVKNHKYNAFWTLVFKEIILTFRNREKLINILFSVLVLPLAIFLLNKIFGAMDIRLTGRFMCIIANILIILLISLASNVSLAHIYSEEGAASYLTKTNPRSYLLQLFSKLIINIVLMSLSILVTTIVFTRFFDFSLINTILIFVFVEGLFLAHLFWTVDFDIMNSQTQAYQTSGAHINDPNEVKSSVIALVLSAIFTYFTYFLMFENSVVVWRKLALITVVLLLLRIWLYINKIKVYYKERQ